MSVVIGDYSCVIPYGFVGLYDLEWYILDHCKSFDFRYAEGLMCLRKLDNEVHHGDDPAKKCPRQLEYR